jgi:glycosyltransferase involved in cell wall biosynthesis
MTKNGKLNSRIRVAHVSLNLNVGGAEKLLVEFARFANRDRFKLHFFSLGCRGILADEVEAEGWPVVAMDEPEGVRTGLIFRLGALFRRWRIDVAHSHNTKPLLYAAPGAWLAAVPAIIHTRHGRGVHSSNRETSAFRMATRLVDRVVCVSQDSARLSATEGVAASKICTIWNGIDVSRFDYTGPKADGPVVFVGRLNPVKDLETLMRAAAIVARHCPSFHLEIAGEGECLPDLMNLARDLCLENRVQFLGEVRNIPDVLARASLLVLSSISEGISLTLLEAMGRGLPVAATRVGGNSEVVVDGENGLLAPAKDPSQLAKAIIEILRNFERSREMGRKGRDRVLKHFQISRMVADYEALYEEVLQG